METLGSSSAKLFMFVENHRQNLHPITYLWCQHTHYSTPSFKLRPSLHRRILLPVAAALSASETDQALTGDKGIPTEATTEFETVHVKFELRRECSFGQHFFMVGEDPMFGLWDPLNAVPLNWSEDHVWTLEMDVPCHKVLKYKFILKGGNDYILWQPGPDRILQTWKTEKNITVCEDWDNAELQTILEEDSFTNHLSESVEGSQVLEETENLLRLHGEPNEALSAEKPIAAVAEDVAGQTGEKEVEDNGYPVAEFTPSADKVANLGVMDSPKTERSSSSGINLESDAAVPVLVPGLTPLPPAENEEEASVSEAENHIGTDSSLNIPEPCVKEEAAIDLPIPKEESEKWVNDKVGVQEKGQDAQLSEEKEQPIETREEAVSVLKNDFDWGLRILKQFLVNLGFVKHHY